MDIKTQCLHLGAYPDEQTGAIIPPIYQSSTYVQSSPGSTKGYEYTRSHNPTRHRLEECLAGLEFGNNALTTSSGMSAIMLIMHALPKGSKILCGDDVYGGTYRLFTTVFHEFHQFEFINTANEDILVEKIKSAKADLIWIESPTNPMLKLTNIKLLSQTIKDYSPKTISVVDNTFMSPIFQNPLELGADLVIHSLTKYINGHSDVVGGVIISKDEDLHKKLWVLQNSIGPCPSPFDSWLVLRGIKTLGIRMKAHEENAKLLANYLENSKYVERVIYPGLSSHPQHQLAATQMKGFGGMITFYLKGGLKESKIFLQKVKLFSLAESLGGVESLIEHPAIMTHASIPTEKRAKLGIADNLIRLSVGIEDSKDLMEDLENAFK